MRKITIVWTLILVMIFACLTIFGFRFKDDKVSSVMENSLKEQSEKYLNTYVGLYPKRGNQIKLTSDQLIEAGYNPNLNTGCIGYVVVKNEAMGFKFYPYVKCSDYMTKGYE